MGEIASLRIGEAALTVLLLVLACIEHRVRTHGRLSEHF